MILHIFSCLLLACSMKSSVTSFTGLKLDYTALPNRKSLKVFPNCKPQLFWVCFESSGHLGHVSYKNRFEENETCLLLTQLFAWTYKVCSPEWSSPRTAAHQGRDGTVTWAWPCLLATTSICQMWARRALGRIPSQGSPPSATPLLSQSPMVWHNSMVWGSWAPHAVSSAQWGCRSCWQPCAPPQDTFELFCFSSGTCLFSTTPCSLSGKVLQILALRFHHQLHLP